ncbi:site-specific integrase [uncultured Microbacterium sp.]|uniref:tyrosine-type recombinase/integrase n=1 Tax=uncultured Microbacterium sp. TaxID=191216 RepID=UPI0028DC4281|nr:site-specific integrase [uncultured Microbacterium sp.]
MPDASPAPRPRKARTSFGTLGQKGAKFYPSYVGPDRQRHRAPAAFGKRSQAQAWLSAQHAAIQAGEWSPRTAQEIAGNFVPARDRPVEFKAFADEYVANRRRKGGKPLAPRTVEGYHYDIATLEMFHGTDLRYITPEQVDAWWASLLDVDEPKVTSAAHAYTLLRAVMSAALEKRLIGTNPVNIPGAGSLRTGKKVRKPSDLEVERVLGGLDASSLALFTCEAWGLLRYGEVIELRPKDLTVRYLEREEGVLSPEVSISVTRAVTWVKKRGAVIGPPKSESGVRDVVLPEAPSTALVAYLESDEAPKDSDALLWPAVLDARAHLRYSVYWRRWADAVEAAGIKYFNPHALRHYGATLLAQAGATTRELQAIAGHSTPAMAMRYQHAADASRQSDLASRAQAVAAENAAKARRIEELRARQAAAAAELAALEAELSRG